MSHQDNKKTIVEDTNSQDSKSKRAGWSDHSVNKLLQLAVDDLVNGKCQPKLCYGGGIHWNTLVTAMQNEFGMGFTEKSIRNKITSLKSDYINWKTLASKSGAGVDGKLSKTEQDVLARSNPGVTKFLNKSFPYADAMEILMGDSVGTGENATKLESIELDNDSDNDEIMEKFDNGIGSSSSSSGNNSKGGIVKKLNVRKRLKEEDEKTSYDKYGKRTRHRGESGQMKLANAVSEIAKLFADENKSSQKGEDDGQTFEKSVALLKSLGLNDDDLADSIGFLMEDEKHHKLFYKLDATIAKTFIIKKIRKN